MTARIIGTGEYKYTRRPNPGEDTYTVLRDAIMLALDDANLTIHDVDGFGVSSFSLEPDRSIDLAYRLGLSLRWLMQDTNGGSSGHNMLANACRSIESGAASCIVMVAGDLLDGEAGTRLLTHYNRATRDHLTSIDSGGPNSVFSMLTQRQMRKYGLEREDYGQVAIAQRKWAQLNPGALYRTPLTMQEYIDAPMVADPLSRFDCVPGVAGATAMVVAHESRARTDRPSVRVRSMVQSFNYDHQQGDGLQTGLASLREEFWRKGLGSPADVDLACVYDDYPAMVLAQLNDIGLVPDGDLKRFVAEAIAGGGLPVNTSGGMLSCGQAGPAGGMHALVEAVRQLQQVAGDRQVPDARLAVATGYGMVLYRYASNVAAALLERV